MNAGGRGIDGKGEPESAGLTRALEISRENGLDTVGVAQRLRGKISEVLVDPKEQAFVNLKHTVLHILHMEPSSKGILHFDANDYWPDLPTHPETQDSELKARVLADQEVQEAIQKALKIGWRNHAVEILRSFAVSDPTKIDAALKSLFDGAIKAGLSNLDAQKSTQGRKVFTEFLPFIFTNPRMQTRLKELLQTKSSAAEVIKEIGANSEAYKIELPEGILYDRFLDYIACIDNKELSLLMTQIDDALSLLDVFEIQANDAWIPDRERVLKGVTAFTPEQWAEIAKFKEPTLLLVPVAGVERFEKAINRDDVKKPAGAKEDAHFSILVPEAFPTKSAITGYQLVVTDGAADVTRRREIRDMHAFQAELAARNVGILSVPAYVLLMLQAMKKGKPLDAKSYTLLGYIKHTIRGIETVFGGWKVDLGRAVFIYNSLTPFYSVMLRTMVARDIPKQ